MSRFGLACKPTWSSWQRKGTKESGVEIVIRNDTLKNYKLKVREARRHYIEVGLADDIVECGIGCVYIPPERSRHYSDEETEQVLGRARACDTMAGDFIWRATKAEWLNFVRDGIEVPDAPVTGGGWRREPRDLDAERVAAPRHLRPAAHQRRFWLAGRPEEGPGVLDYIMFAPAWSSQGLVAGRP